MLHLGEDLRNRLDGREGHGRAELVARGGMRERPFRPEVRDGELALQRARRGDDLAEDRAHALIGERSLVESPQAVEDALLATRDPESVRGGDATRSFVTPDPLRDASALVQKPHETFIDAVDLGALLIDVAVHGLHRCVARGPQTSTATVRLPALQRASAVARRVEGPRVRGGSTRMTCAGPARAHAAGVRTGVRGRMMAPANARTSELA